MPGRRIRRWFAHLAAFTAGVVLGERLLPGSRPAAVGPSLIDLARDGVETVASTIGSANDARLARWTTAVGRSVVGFTPPGRPRLRVRPR